MVAVVTLRLPPSSWDRMEEFCARNGLTFRAGIEGAFACFLDLDARTDLSEDEARAVEACWGMAADIDREAAARGPERVKRNVRMERDLLKRAKAVCARRGVSVNALATAGFLSLEEPEVDDVLTACWRCAVTYGRRRDHERRTGRSPKGACC